MAVQLDGCFIVYSWDDSKMVEARYKGKIVQNLLLHMEETGLKLVMNDKVEVVHNDRWLKGTVAFIDDPSYPDQVVVLCGLQCGVPAGMVGYRIDNSLKDVVIKVGSS